MPEPLASIKTGRSQPARVREKEKTTPTPTAAPPSRHNGENREPTWRRAVACNRIEESRADPKPAQQLGSGAEGI